MGRGEFVAEGQMEIGPSEYYFVFLDGSFLGKLLVDRFQLPAERAYTRVGRVRITVERLEDDEATEEASPT